MSGVAQAGGDSLAETLQADDTGRGGWRSIPFRR
jgi:hypothetical protein